MSKTSTEAKKRYNSKTYSRFVADLRNEDFEKVETLRGDMSRAAFLKMLVDRYCKDLQQADTENIPLLSSSLISDHAKQ